MPKVSRERLQMDIDYVKSIREKYDRAYQRINELTLEKTQLQRRVKILDDAFEALNKKYLIVCKELENLKGN